MSKWLNALVSEWLTVVELTLNGLKLCGISPWPMTVPYVWMSDHCAASRVKTERCRVALVRPVCLAVSIWVLVMQVTSDTQGDLCCECAGRASSHLCFVGLKVLHNKAVF